MCTKLFKFRSIRWFDTLPSTNTWLREYVRDDPAIPAGTVIAARAQTAGRGRQQRVWHTEPGRNLTFSFLWNAPVEERFIPAMAQAISVGIAEYLNAEGLTSTIKWPNDVLIDGKKVSGILCERLPAADGRVVIVAGVGLNVNMGREEAAAIDQPATSLALELGATRDVERVLEGLLPHLERSICVWSESGFPGIAAAYTRHALPPGSAITVRDGDRKVAGRLAGFTDDGALRLVMEKDGGERVFYSGDIAPG